MEYRDKIAVLIDYDNFNKNEYLSALFEELNDYGDIIIKSAYYSNMNDTKLKDKFIQFGIQPKSQISYSKGKNAVDIKMTIDAMSLLDKDYIDIICLATNDSDFTPLVYHLQQNNKVVFGAGDNTAKESYKNTFNNFISVEKITTNIKVNNKDEALVKLIKEIKEIIQKNKDESNYADFSVVIQTLKNKMKDFNPKNYGAQNKQVLPFFKEKLNDYFEVYKKEKTIYIKSL